MLTRIAGRKRLAATAAALVAGGALVAGATGALAGKDDQGAGQPGPTTTTPIKHVVVLFQENVSFDHYFGTYPWTQSDPSQGDQQWQASPGTPTVNGLGNPYDVPNSPLLKPNNKNSDQPFLLHRNQAYTCDQGHDYGQEQAAFDKGLMDMFVEQTGSANGNPGCDRGHGKGIVMGYYDGGTVTAMWNYAQNFAMSDNSYNTTFGPSTPGALNLVSGQTNGAPPGVQSGSSAETTGTTADASASGTVIGDPQPTGDICTTRDNARMLKGQNIGDLLNKKNITWGWFNGGFRNPNGGNPCHQTHTGADGKQKVDYIPHHEPFQYYTSTANLQHLPPSSPDMIGKTDQANHQYDLSDFWTAVGNRNMPAVSYLKAPGYQDGHAGYSSPLLEQQFITDTINRLQQSPEWKSTAVVIAYDDSDGWYDHQMSPIVNHSQDPNDQLSGPGQCGTRAPRGAYPGRCGYGPRLPLLVISPYAKRNFVDGTLTDQSSILRFIEDNWQTGRIGNASFDELAGPLNNMFDFQQHSNNKLFLDPNSGQVSNDQHGQGDNNGQ